MVAYIFYIVIGLYTVQNLIGIIRNLQIKRSQVAFDEKLAKLRALLEIATQPEHFLEAAMRLDRLIDQSKGTDQLKECVRLSGYMEGKHRAYHPKQEKIVWNEFLTKKLPVMSN